MPWRNLLPVFPFSECSLISVCTFRCDILDVAAEVDRILRPGRWFVLKDTMDMIKKMRPVLRSLHYETVIVKRQYLVATKSFWRPGASRSWLDGRDFQGTYQRKKIRLTLWIPVGSILLYISDIIWGWSKQPWSFAGMDTCALCCSGSFLVKAKS
jgi:hypothetical protein